MDAKDRATLVIRNIAYSRNKALIMGLRCIARIGHAVISPDENISKLENDQLFRALIATAVDGIVVIDAAGMIQVYNQACERLFGYSSEEVIGSNVKMLMPTPYHQEHDGYLANYHNTHERKIIGIGREVVGQRKDLSTFPMYLSVGEGDLGGRKIFVGIIHDQSAQKKADDAIKEREARLRSILDTVPDAIRA